MRFFTKRKQKKRLVTRPPVCVFVLFPLDVVFRLDVSVKGAIVRETLWAQGAFVGRARTLQRIQEILQLKAGF